MDRLGSRHCTRLAGNISPSQIARSPTCNHTHQQSASARRPLDCSSISFIIQVKQTQYALCALAHTNRAGGSMIITAWLYTDRILHARYTYTRRQQTCTTTTQLNKHEPLSRKSVQRDDTKCCAGIREFHRLFYTTECLAAAPAPVQPACCAPCSSCCTFSTMCCALSSPRCTSAHSNAYSM